MGLPKHIVYRFAKELEIKGYVKPIRESKSPRLFKRTSIDFPVYHRGWSKAFYHHAPIKFNILRYATKPIFFDKEWESSGIKHQLLKNLIVNDKEGSCKVKTIRISQGKNKSSIMIWMDDEIICSVNQLVKNADEHLKISQRVANYLSREYGFQFSLPELNQDAHFSMKIDDKIVDAGKEIKRDNVWMDKSKGYGEIETNDVQIALTWMDIDQILNRLDKRLEQVEKDQANQGNALRKFFKILNIGLEGMQENELENSKDWMFQ